jgi:hypothetical protein
MPTKSKENCVPTRFTLKGGKHGAIIKANDPANSELIKRLLLPEEDEHHMPPKGKTPLTEQEIALLHWWIQQGASFNKKVAQLKPDEKVKPLLASLKWWQYTRKW